MAFWNFQIEVPVVAVQCCLGRVVRGAVTSVILRTVFTESLNANGITASLLNRIGFVGKSYVGDECDVQIGWNIRQHSLNPIVASRVRSAKVCAPPLQ